jgi:hypothetical protein
MASNGTYGVVYCGTDGLGVGVFNLKDGVIVGADYVGGRYHATATENAASGEIELDLSFEVPADVVLVQGTAPQDAPHSRRFALTLPADFGDGTPVELESRAPPNIARKTSPRASIWWSLVRAIIGQQSSTASVP